MKEDVLPEGWEYEQLSKKTEIILGQSPEGIYVNAIGKGVPFYQGKTEFGDLYPTVKNYCEKPKKIAEKNNVLLSVRAPVGPTNLATETTAIGRGLAAINCLDNDYKFILYQFRFIEPWLKNQGTGTTFQAITGNFIKNLKFIFPPLPEQQYLSQKLTALLDEVAQTKQRLEAIPALLKQFRQSVLADAVSGRLTEEWRGSSSYDEDGYPIDWDKKKLSDLGVLNRGKSKHRPRNDPQLFGIEYPFIQTGDVANSNGEIWNSRQFYSQFGLAQSKLFPKDTLCITIAANIADTSILRIDACFPDSIVGFISNDNNNVLFIKYLIYVNKNNLERFAPATAQKNINLKILNELVFSVPPKEEQTQIVQKVETYFALADEIETQVNAALENVNLLTQSILAKAFSGELSAEWRKEKSQLI